MVVAWRQFKALFSIYIQDGLAYKASAVIWVMTDVATAATMPMVMMAATKGGNIKGFTGSDFVLYYLTMLLVTCFVQCHFMWDVSMEIKEGVFSSQIIRPVNYIYYHAVRNFAWRIFRTAIFSPIFLLILWAYSSWIVSPQIHLTWYSILAILLGHFLSYFFVMAMGMLALFLQETQSLFELYYVPMLFLSGQMFPVAIFPEWVRNLAMFFPFYYTTGVPTEMLIGRIGAAQAPHLLLLQCAWIIGSFVAFKIMFHFGTRHYTGVGM